MSLKHKYFHGTRISKNQNTENVRIFEFSFVQNKNRFHLLHSFNIIQQHTLHLVQRMNRPIQKIIILSFLLRITFYSFSSFHFHFHTRHSSFIWVQWSLSFIIQYRFETVYHECIFLFAQRKTNKKKEHIESIQSRKYDGERWYSMPWSIALGGISTS